MLGNLNVIPWFRFASDSIKAVVDGETLRSHVLTVFIAPILNLVIKSHINESYMCEMRN